MQRPLEIVFRGISPSEAIEVKAREKAEKLERFYPRMTGCRVTVELPERHKHQGNAFNVRVDITVPGSEIVANRHSHEDAYVALRDAFEAATRQLEDFARRQRRDTKAHATELNGRVARTFAEEGYGFIEAADGREFYFSRDNVANAEFERLEPGNDVLFIEDMGGEGLQAKRVTLGRASAEE